VTDFIIEAQQLTKSFRGHNALRGLNLQVPRGAIYGFLGRNGAGKTTTIKTLLGLIQPDLGHVEMFGLPVSDADGSVETRRRIGFVTEDKELYPFMTVEQIIAFTRPFFPGWRRDLEQRYLELFDLPRRRKISALSKGMRSKLMLLLAISHGAELLILDEPSDGLDPAATDDLLRELASLIAAEGTTLFFSSHQLSEVDAISDHVGIINQGRMVVQGSLDDMKLQYARLSVGFTGEVREPHRWVDGVQSVRRDGRMLSLVVTHNADAVAEQARTLPGALVERFPLTLKEIFLETVRNN
jgi:ABC-2 type transport system ATP-binding protein